MIAITVYNLQKDVPSSAVAGSSMERLDKHCGRCEKQRAWGQGPGGSAVSWPEVLVCVCVIDV